MLKPWKFGYTHHFGESSCIGHLSLAIFVVYLKGNGGGDDCLHLAGVLVSINLSLIVL